MSNLSNEENIGWQRIKQNKKAFEFSPKGVEKVL